MAEHIRHYKHSERSEEALCLCNPWFQRQNAAQLPPAPLGRNVYSNAFNNHPSPSGATRL